MDNILFGPNTICEAFSLQQELIQLLNLDGSTLKKWNILELISDFSQEFIQFQVFSISAEDNSFKNSWSPPTFYIKVIFQLFWIMGLY